MSLKSIPFAFIMIFSSVILSCVENYTCPEALPYFEVVGLEGTAYRKGNETPLTISNPIKWIDIVFSIGLTTSGVADTKTSYSGNLFAFDCASDGYLGSQIGIESLQIRPLTPYSDLDTPDSFSEELFSVEVGKELMSIQEFNLNYREEYTFTRFQLVLNRPPEINGEIHQFELELGFVNGKKIKYTTGELLIVI